MIRWGLACLLGGCLLIYVGWKLGRTSVLLQAALDPNHQGCQATIGRLSAELGKETRDRVRQQAAADYFHRVATVQRRHIDWQDQRINQLEHEQAIDGGTTLPAEIERFLAEQDGGL